jgi:hypothetical protein
MVAAEFDENTIARIQKSINSGSVNKLNVPELEQWIKEQTNKEAK